MSVPARLDEFPLADEDRRQLAEIVRVLDEVLGRVRIWSSVVSGHVLAKDAAAEWALPRLPVEHRCVLAQARDIYLGTRQEDWDDLLDALPGFVDAVVGEVRLAGSTEPRR